MGGVRVARLRQPLYVPCVSDHYSSSTYAPFVVSRLAGVTWMGRVKGGGVRSWVLYVVMWGLVSLGHWC